GQNGAAASGTPPSATPASGTDAQNAGQNGNAQTNSGGAPATTSGPPGLEAVDSTFGKPGDKTISRDVTRNYEINRTLDYMSQPAGTVRRLTVAVLIGDRTVTGTDGKSKQVPLSADDMARVTQLVKDAVGFDASRGDSVSVVNESLDTGTAPAAADGTFQAPPLWQTPIFWSFLRIGAGLVVVLVLVLSVLRPLVKTLITPMRFAPAAHALPTGIPGAPGGATALPPGREAAVAVLSHEQQLTQARSMVNQDPKRVAQVVRSWVGSDE
ncbi:MAG: flagellar M-ring protein FliF C-terminal domain-containing protein, partial [Steroidobacteraceae bacterium]